MSNDDYKIARGGSFAPVAKLSINLDRMSEVIPFTQFNEPYPDSLHVGMSAMIGDEMILVYELGTGTMKARRGCMDTIPAPHNVGDSIWFIESDIQGGFKEYTAGQQIGVKVLPYIPAGKTLPLTAAAPYGLTFNWRFFRPYPPAQMRCNTARWYMPALLNADTAALALSWVDRNRVVQADQLVGHDEADVAPEAGTTYTMRVYDGGTLVRTEAGITGHGFNYTWAQAISDFGVGTDPEGMDFPGHIIFCSVRDDIESWQNYRIDFTLNNRHAFEFAAMSTSLVMQEDPQPALMRGIVSAESTSLTAQTEDYGPTKSMMSAQIVEAAGMLTSFYTPLTRKLFESTYVYNAKRGHSPVINATMSTTARPMDRLTDSHKLYGRGHPTQTFGVKDMPEFTPWVDVDNMLMPLDTVVNFTRSSLTDGVPLSNVRVGQFAILGGEIVRVDAITSSSVTIARGCLDTVPANHRDNDRLWFIEAAGGIDPGEVPVTYRSFRVSAAGLDAVEHAPHAVGLYDATTDQMLVGVGRSYTMVRIRKSDCSITFTGHYDIFEVPAEALRLAADLDATNDDHFVLVYSYDEPQTNHINATLVAAMQRCGATPYIFGVPGALRYRGVYVLIGTPGNPSEAPGYERWNGLADNDPHSWLDIVFVMKPDQAHLVAVDDEPVVSIPKSTSGGYADDATVENKVVPDVYGPPLDLNVIPTDKTTIKRRSMRPYPPGYLRVNGRPWYEGATVTPEQDAVFTWNQRNRITQGTTVIAHEAPHIPHEPNTTYRFLIQVVVPKKEGPPQIVTVREMYASGTTFTYTYEMAQVDGARVGSLLKACQYTVVPMYVDAIRDDLGNWQGYAVPLTLPAPPCPINQQPGGGQGPSSGGSPGTGGGTGGTGGSGGNGSSGGGVGGTPTPPPPNPPPSPTPPTWPPVPPGPIKPGTPGEPDPGDTTPDPGDTGEHWDYKWDIHWDAYRRFGDNTGQG